MRVTRSVIPNLFTLANLFCGFAAIVACFEGHLDRAALLIITAGVFDMLDGVVARITRSTSEFGVELDSLCDAVSFGVAPSAMLYQAMFHDWHQWGLLLASLPALAGVLRLARFNIQLTSMEDKLYFRGMPIPAGAFMIVSYLALWLPSESIPEHDQVRQHSAPVNQESPPATRCLFRIFRGAGRFGHHRRQGALPIHGAVFGRRRNPTPRGVSARSIRAR
jgi:CDP-diacylglycerol--serine O-phosphatidyltransferase